jgi:hypothetical protein
MELPRGNLFVELKHFPCDVPEDHKFYVNEEQHSLRPFAYVLPVFLNCLKNPVDFVS